MLAGKTWDFEAGVEYSRFGEDGVDACKQRRGLLGENSVESEYGPTSCR